MATSAALLLFAGFVGAQFPSGEPEHASRIRVLVLPVGAATDDETARWTNALAVALRPLHGLNVRALDEDDHALRERWRECSTRECACAIGSAALADEVIVGDVRIAGDSLHIKAVRLRVADAALAGELVERVSGEPNARARLAGYASRLYGLELLDTSPSFEPPVLPAVPPPPLPDKRAPPQPDHSARILYLATSAGWALLVGDVFMMAAAGIFGVLSAVGALGAAVLAIQPAMIVLAVVAVGAIATMIGILAPVAAAIPLGIYAASHLQAVLAPTRAIGLRPAPPPIERPVAAQPQPTTPPY